MHFVENFNEFVDLCGGFLQDGDGMLIRKIQSTTEIVKLLTVGDGNDWLCRTVDIIVSYNYFYSNLHMTCSIHISDKCWL
jgi:hypothetical protein